VKLLYTLVVTGTIIVLSTAIVGFLIGVCLMLDAIAF